MAEISPAKAAVAAAIASSITTAAIISNPSMKQVAPAAQAYNPTPTVVVPPPVLKTIDRSTLKQQEITHQNYGGK